MIQQCLNYRNLTYDFCFRCPKKGRDLDCPEYLASVEHNYTRQTVERDKLTRTVPLQSRAELGLSAEKPFYFGHVELMHNVVLPKTKMMRLIRKGMEGIL